LHFIACDSPGNDHVAVVSLARQPAAEHASEFQLPGPWAEREQLIWSQSTGSGANEAREAVNDALPE
jgi:hypothetical protein